MFDKSKPYGTSMGGVLGGFLVQDDKHYHPQEFFEVDADGNKLPEQKSSKAAKQAEAKPAEVSELSTELND
jgi:hypothetical protein